MTVVIEHLVHSSKNIDGDKVIKIFGKSRELVDKVEFQLSKKLG